MHRTLALSLSLCAACTEPPIEEPPVPETETEDPSDGVLVGGMPADSRHLGLGVPTRTGADDHVMIHPQLALGYNRFLNASSWVSWQTRPEDFGPVDRYAGNFYPDTTLPADWYRTDHSDMYGSGYDRGHMLRSEERTRTSDENYATFVMTNVLPQRADLNRGPWFDFELYVQRRVESTTTPRDAYVVAGAVWPAACPLNKARQLGDGCLDVGTQAELAKRIAVPEATWKIVVFVDAGVALADAVDPYVVAVVMPNVRGIEDVRWWTYRKPVAEVEQASGYDVPARRVVSACRSRTRRT